MSSVFTDIHKQYGSNSALRMGGQESDLESIVSSDVSMFMITMLSGEFCRFSCHD